MLKLLAIFLISSCARYSIQKTKKPYVYMNEKFTPEHGQSLQCKKAKEELEDYVCLHVDDFESLIHKKIDE